MGVLEHSKRKDSFFMLNRILPFLLNLMDFQAKIKKTPPDLSIEKEGHGKKILTETPYIREKYSPAWLQGKLDYDGLGQKVLLGESHQAFSLIPLPLKTPFFPTANLYLVHDRNKNKADVKEAEQKTRVSLLLILRTTHLGVLRLFVRQEEKILWLACLGHEAAVKNLLAGELAGLEEEILALGYEKVFFNFKHLSPDKNINISTGPDFPGTEFIFDLYV